MLLIYLDNQKSLNINPYCTRWSVGCLKQLMLFNGIAITPNRASQGD